MRFTRDEFIEAVNKLKEMWEQENALTKAIGSSDWVGADWVGNYYDLVLEMCELDSNGYNDFEYFVYTLDFGRRWLPGVFKYRHGEDIPLRDASDLWNLLIRKD